MKTSNLSNDLTGKHEKQQKNIIYKKNSQVNTSTNTSSSGITSCDESDESIQNVPIRDNSFLSLNTIKYNAKTNILQQQKFSAKTLSNSYLNKNLFQFTTQSNGIRNFSSSPKSLNYNWINKKSYIFSPESTQASLKPRVFYNKTSSSTISTGSLDQISPFPNNILNGSGYSTLKPSNVEHVKLNYLKTYDVIKSNSSSLPLATSSSIISTSSGCSSFNPLMKPVNETRKCYSKTIRPVIKIKRAYFNNSNKRPNVGNDRLIIKNNQKNIIDYENLIRRTNQIISFKKIPQLPSNTRIINNNNVNILRNNINND